MIDLAASTDGGKMLMHEGFCVKDDTEYTREWFAWANAMFSELVMDYCGSVSYTHLECGYEETIALSYTYDGGNIRGNEEKMQQAFESLYEQAEKRDVYKRQQFNCVQFPIML